MLRCRFRRYGPHCLELSLTHGTHGCLYSRHSSGGGGYRSQQTEHDTHELGPYDFDTAESGYEAIRQSHNNVEEIAWMMGSVALTPIR